MLVTCGNRSTTLYLKALQDEEITITLNKEEAVVFSLKVLNEYAARHNFEFSLASTLATYKQESDKLKTCPLNSAEPEIPAMDMYLETNFSTITGKGNNPPIMRTNANFKKTRLLLKKRIDHRIAIDPKQWKKGREPCYIACIGQWLFVCDKDHWR